MWLPATIDESTSSFTIDWHDLYSIDTATGEVTTGCNIENASYGLTICAERATLFTAVAAGNLQFTQLAIVVDTPALTPPCGACRQVIWELAGDIEIILGNLTGDVAVHQMRDLLPHAFDAGFLTQ